MSTVARFKIGKKVYSTAALDEISLKDLMLFNTQAADMGLTERWSDVERISQEMANMTEAEAETHPGKMLMVGVTVWAARRIAGEQVTFDEAVSIPVGSIVFLPATEDRKPGPTKGAKPRKASEPDADDLAPSSSDETPTT